MAFSNLYSAICRGKWFISFRDVEANMLLVEKILLDNDITKDASVLSDRDPIPIFMSTGDKEAKSGNSFADAPNDSTAIIPIRGTLLKYGSYCAYGTMEYGQIIRQAADSQNISSIILDIDSGGGSVDAIAPVVDAIQYAKSKSKWPVARVDLCASAAYYIASYCNEIIATNSISAEIGSIGVMMSFPDYAKYYEKEGVKIHTVYSNLSDYKNAPFEAARKGEYELIKTEELDPLARDFQKNVKANRSGKLKTDTKGILNGRMFYAEDAVSKGLIDGIDKAENIVRRVRELSREACITEYINSKN